MNESDLSKYAACQCFAVLKTMSNNKMLCVFKKRPLKVFRPLSFLA